MADTFRNVPDVGGVGLSLESTPGTAETLVNTTLKLDDGGDFGIEEEMLKEFTHKLDGEPFARARVALSFASKGNVKKAIFAPGNFIPELFKVFTGNPWVSDQIHTLSVETGGGATFKRGDVIFGATSLARGRVVKVAGDVLYLIEVGGVFSSGEDLYDKPSGTDYAKNTASVSAAVADLYGHRMVMVADQTNQTGVIASTVATKAYLGDLMVDFRRLQRTAVPRRVEVVVTDAATTPVNIQGWIGEAVQVIPFDGGSSEIHAGDNLLVGAVTIGTILYVELRTGSWVTEDAAGFIYVTPAGVSVANEAALIDDNGTPGSAEADLPTIKSYPYNACKIYTDENGSTQTWNGDYTTFDETDVLTYTASQRVFTTPYTLTMFGKQAGNKTLKMRGSKISSLALKFSQEQEGFLFDAELMGLAHGEATTEPVYPARVTSKLPWGASARTVELDGASTGMAAYVLDGDISLTRDFDKEKSLPLGSSAPADLLETTIEVVGKLRAQFKSNEYLKYAWRGASATSPSVGSTMAKRLAVALTNGETLATSYTYEFAMTMLGIVSVEALDKAPEGYVQPITLTGIMRDSTYNWSPFEVYVIDGSTSH